MNNLFVISCKVLDNYKIEIQFSDGYSGVCNVKEALWGELFEPLKNLEYFKTAFVSPEMKTVCWPNGADFAPEFLKNLCDELVIV